MLLERNEMMWKQRSQALWLDAGDQNSKYFHNEASQLRHKSFIAKLQDDLGIWWEVIDLGKLSVEYFTDLFSNSHSWGIDTILATMQPKVTTSMNDVLLQPYTSNKVY